MRPEHPGPHVSGRTAAAGQQGVWSKHGAPEAALHASGLPCPCRAGSSEGTSGLDLPAQQRPGSFQGCFGLACHRKTGCTSASPGRSLQHSASRALPPGAQRKPTALSPESCPGRGPAPVMGMWIGRPWDAVPGRRVHQDAPRPPSADCPSRGLHLCAYAA